MDRIQTLRSRAMKPPVLLYNTALKQALKQSHAAAVRGGLDPGELERELLTVSAPAHPRCAQHPAPPPPHQPCKPANRRLEMGSSVY